jgi:mannitol-1-phosphate/altronate dehydrogenase
VPRPELFADPRYVTLVGLGRLQLGLIGPVFTDLGYELLAVSLKQDGVAERIQQHGCYKLISKSVGAKYREVPVAYASTLADDQAGRVDAAAMERIAHSKLVNFGMGYADDAVVRAARFLLELVRYRREHGIVEELLVTCSDNPSGRLFAVEGIRRTFIELCQRLEPEECEKVWNDVAFHVLFVRTLSDRICPARSVPDNGSPVVVLAEEYGRLVFDKGFCGIEPLLLKADSVHELATSSHMEFERQKKFYTLSMAHSIAAYLSTLVTPMPQTVFEAMRNSKIDNAVRQALKDVAAAFSRSGASEDSSDFTDLGTLAYKRLNNQDIDDEVRRVARDVPRKLGLDDRLVGPLVLVYETGFKVSKPLVSAVGAALAYAARYGSVLPVFEGDTDTQALGERLRAGEEEKVVHDLLGMTGGRSAYLEKLRDEIILQYHAFSH